MGFDDDDDVPCRDAVILLSWLAGSAIRSACVLVGDAATRQRRQERESRRRNRREDQQIPARHRSERLSTVPAIPFRPACKHWSQQALFHDADVWTRRVPPEPRSRDLKNSRIRSAPYAAKCSLEQD